MGSEIWGNLSLILLPGPLISVGTPHPPPPTRHEVYIIGEIRLIGGQLYLYCTCWPAGTQKSGEGRDSGGLISDNPELRGRTRISDEITQNKYLLLKTSLLLISGAIMSTKIDFAPVSHAKEDIVPGTVFLQPEEGDKTAFGQALFPVPTLDPNDPLLWPKWRKYVYLFCVIFFTLMGNSSCLTPSVFFVPWSREFNVPETQVTDVQNYAILVYGLVNLIWVPLALKYGRRPTWLAALTIWWILYMHISRYN